MTFDARKLAAELPDEPFPFIGMDGETYQLPNAATLTGAQAHRMQAGDDDVLEEIADPDVYEALMAMPVKLSGPLAQAWIEHGRAAGKAGGKLSARRKPTKRSPST